MAHWDERRPAALLLFASMLWGSSFVGSKICLNAGLMPFETVFYRMLIGTALMGLVFWRQLRRFSREALRTGLLLGLVTSLVYTFEMYGISMTEAAKASFLTSTNIVMMPFLYALFFHVRPQMRSILAGAAAFLGVCLLSMTETAGLALSLGDGLLLFTAFLYAMNSITVAKLGQGAPSVQITFLQLLTTMLFTGFMTFVQGRCGHYPPEALGALGYLALGPTLVCFLIKNYAIQRIDPVKCTLILATEGIFCALLSLAILKERLTGRMLAGIVLILSGILIEELGAAGKKERAAPSQEETAGSPSGAIQE